MENHTVNVTMAFYGAHPWVRRAVRSILDQTYTDWRLFLISDADPHPPWPIVEDLTTDPRVITYEMRENRGRFFIDAAILAAVGDDGYWALQDPDDRAEPARFADLVPLAAETGMAVAPSCWHKRGDDDPLRVFDTKRYLDDPLPDRIESHVGYGSGVFTIERVRRAGGFLPSVRIGYDTFLMNAAKLVGPWAHKDDVAYQHKTTRPLSLGTSVQTRWGSPQRRQTRAMLDELWREFYRRYQQGDDPTTVIREAAPAKTWEAVDVVAAELKERIHESNRILGKQAHPDAVR